MRDSAEAPASIARLRSLASRPAADGPVGSRVRVRGWVSVGQDGLRRNGRLYAYVRDARGGLRLEGAHAVPLAPGDAVEVTGTLAMSSGDLYLAVEGVEHRRAPKVLPVAQRLSDTSHADSLLGTLVTLRGVVASTGRIPVGQSLSVLVGDSLVYAVRFNDAPATYSFANYEPGQQVEVTGVLGRYRTALQVYPRSGDDIRTVGLRPSLYRFLAYFVGGLLLLALAWAVHLVGVGRKRLAALAVSQRHFKLLFTRAETGVVVAMPVPGGVRVLQANPAAVRLVGAHRSVCQPDGEAVRLEEFFLHDADYIQQHLDTLAKIGRIRTDAAMRGADDSVRHVTIESYSVAENGAPLYFTFLHDMTQRLAHEAALVEARENAEDFARMQNTFLRNMSHELRTPLAGIIGFAEVLQSELDGEPKQFARYIEEGGKRLLSTLQDVLDLTRFTAGTASLDILPCDAVALVREVETEVAGEAAEAGLLLDVHVPASAPVEQDPKAIKRVLCHLVENAIKFTSPGGSVRVRLDSVDDAHVRFAVEDTGIGMSEAFQQRLFTLYAQESSGYARSHEGVGIGLHLVQTLVHEMGGSVRVESARGVGTTIEVLLPRRRAERAAAAPPAAMAPASAASAEA